jgi:hypothetical protein
MTPRKIPSLSDTPGAVRWLSTRKKLTAVLTPRSLLSPRSSSLADYDITTKVKDADDLKQYIDSSDYFFVSKLVAKEFPTLYESKFIQVMLLSHLNSTTTTIKY